MDIILPVAGLGTRLRPQTWSKPKPLVGLAGKPMLAHVLDRVLPLEPDQLVFITGFLGDQIEAWARANYDRAARLRRAAARCSARPTRSSAPATSSLPTP